MSEKGFVKELTKMEEDFSKWYTDIVIKADMVDYSPVRGCMVIKPYGYAIWENIQKEFDILIKKTGHKNCYFPLLIPESLLKKEEEHVEGFAPEVAWVTEGGNEKLEERLAIRPTSETIICNMYSKWVRSWRDLPLLYNQWCNVLRWEKTTRPFLRTAEFLWQEGHTVHATAEEAQEETIQQLNAYTNLVENYLAIPVIRGQKTESEKFAGAEKTYTLEAMMHDGKALQTATSHNLGHHFTKAFEIEFLNKEGKKEYAYHTSWGFSTRTIGGIIMVHGDNRGLKLPPKIAPIQVIVVPIAMHKEGVLDKAYEIKKLLEENYRVDIDDREQYSPGYKFNEWELKGVPLRLEIGPKDIENNQVVLVRRDTNEKIIVKNNELCEMIDKLLNDIHNNMYKMAKENLDKNTSIAKNMNEFKEILKNKNSFIKAMWCGNEECVLKIKEETSATSRCIPFEQENLLDTCVCCGKDAKKEVIFAKAY